MIFYKWKTRLGEEIPIEEMTDEHLSNALKVCFLKKEYDFAYAIMNEIDRRDPTCNWTEPS